jgi:hypothetical protein
LGFCDILNLADSWHRFPNNNCFRTAIARKHPDAEAVDIMGWVGFLAVVPYITAILSLRLLFRAIQSKLVKFARRFPQRRPLRDKTTPASELAIAIREVFEGHSSLNHIASNFAPPVASDSCTLHDCK